MESANEELVDELEARAAAALGQSVRISVLDLPRKTIDSTTKLLVYDRRGPRAAILCSSRAAPNSVQQGVERASKAKAVLGTVLGTRILDPLLAGEVGGLSFALFPYCRGLSESALVWAAQRVVVRQAMLAWLFAVNERTVRAVPSDKIDAGFIEPLKRLASDARLGKGARTAARDAIMRVKSGAWRPVSTLMHGDLWKGNLLIRHDQKGGRWADRLVVIDWPASTIQGYGIFDLVRLSQSLRVGRTGFIREVERHCRTLGCERADAKSYLLAALGHLLLELHHFPGHRFVEMAHSCIRFLDTHTGHVA